VPPPLPPPPPPPAATPASASASTGSKRVEVPATIFSKANVVSSADRRFIESFFEQMAAQSLSTESASKEIVLNEEEVEEKESGKKVKELIVLVLDFQTQKWKRIKRKAGVNS